MDWISRVMAIKFCSCVHVLGGGVLKVKNWIYGGQKED